MFPQKNNWITQISPKIQPCSKYWFCVHNKRIKESKRLHHCNRNEIKLKNNSLWCAKRIHSNVISLSDCSLGSVVIRILITLFWFSSFVPSPGNFRYRELISLSAKHARSYMNTYERYEVGKKSFIDFILEVRWISYLGICICIRIFCVFPLPYFTFIDSFIHLFVRFISSVRESGAKLFLTISMTYIKKKYNVSIGGASSILSI